VLRVYHGRELGAGREDKTLCKTPKLWSLATDEKGNPVAGPEVIDGVTKVGKRRMKYTTKERTKGVSRHWLLLAKGGGESQVKVFI